MPPHTSGDPLFGHDVEQALSEIPEDLDVLGRTTWLRRRLGADLGRRAAGLLNLRRKSRARLGDGWLPYLLPKASEQATARVVAEDRAETIMRNCGGVAIWDSTCSIGSDSLAAALIGHRVIASDRDEETLRYAQANLSRCGDQTQVVRADVCRPPVRADVLLVDPDRRPDGQRESDPARWSPSLRIALEVATRHGGACIKLPPALDPRLVSTDALRSSLSWVSLDGELREISLWTGQLAGPSAREAKVLSSSGARAVLRGEPIDPPSLMPEEARNIRWLAEPDPAVLRSGLLGIAAEEIGFRCIDPHIAYLAGDREPNSAWVRAWPVLACVPLDRKRVRALLASHDIGPVTVKKRGHPEDSDRLAKRFAGPGSRHGLLAVARLDSGHVAYLLDSQSSIPRSAQGL